MELPGALKEQVGPLPVGVWALAIAGGLGVSIYLHRRSQASAATAAASDPSVGVSTATGTDPGVGNLAVVGTPGQGSTTIGGAVIQTNEDWRQAVERALFARGFNPSLVDSAVAKYLDGDQLTTAEQAVIEIALGMIGPAPSMVPPIQLAPPVVPLNPPPPTSPKPAPGVPVSIPTPIGIPAPPTYPAPTAITIVPQPQNNPANNPLVVGPLIPLADGASLPAASGTGHQYVMPDGTVFTAG